MVDKQLGVDSEVHELKLGKSFSKDEHVGFHTIRYDFKPASVDTTKMASVEIEEKHSVSVTVPHVESSGTTHTVYKGNKRPIAKECVLIIDHQTGEITLEKLTSTVQLKKTRPRPGQSFSQIKQASSPVITLHLSDEPPSPQAAWPDDLDDDVNLAADQLPRPVEELDVCTERGSKSAAKTTDVPPVTEVITAVDKLRLNQNEAPISGPCDLRSRSKKTHGQHAPQGVKSGEVNIAGDVQHDDLPHTASLRMTKAAGCRCSTRSSGAVVENRKKLSHIDSVEILKGQSEFLRHGSTRSRHSHRKHKHRHHSCHRVTDQTPDCGTAAPSAPVCDSHKNAEMCEPVSIRGSDCLPNKNMVSTNKAQLPANLNLCDTKVDNTTYLISNSRATALNSDSQKLLSLSATDQSKQSKKSDKSVKKGERKMGKSEPDGCTIGCASVISRKARKHAKKKNIKDRLEVDLSKTPIKVEALAQTVGHRLSAKLGSDVDNGNDEVEVYTLSEKEHENSLAALHIKHEDHNCEVPDLKFLPGRSISQNHIETRVSTRHSACEKYKKDAHGKTREARPCHHDSCRKGAAAGIGLRQVSCLPTRATPSCLNLVNSTAHGMAAAVKSKSKSCTPHNASYHQAIKSEPLSCLPTGHKGQGTLTPVSNATSVSDSSIGQLLKTKSKRKNDHNNKLSGSLTDSQSSTSSCEIVEFSEHIENDIRGYLQSHEIPQERRPKVSIRYSPTQMKLEHPDIYHRIQKRLNLPEEDLDSLTTHLCMAFPEYLMGTSNIYGLLERLEDASDFVIDQYAAYKKQQMHEYLTSCITDDDNGRSQQ